jgi:hypothetical protein
MIIKLNTHKIKYQSNNSLYVWGYNNFIKSKINQIIKNNSKDIIE